MNAATGGLPLRDGVTLLDGSMGQELINRGAGGDGVLWAAEALFNYPETVLDIHRDYIAAGADVICTNSYSCIRNKFEPSGVVDRLGEMNRLAGELAQRARDGAGREVLIAGSLPPQKGSYRPDLVADDDELYALYSEQAGFLADYVDLFLCETMSTASEARCAATAALETGRPVWVSWTLRDEGPPLLRSGETLREALRAVHGLNISACSVNCSTPEAVSLALPELLQLTDRPVGGYANGFTPIPDKWDYRSDRDLPPPRRDVGPGSYAEFAAQWIRAGARFVGGCCQIGPAHIRALRSLIDRQEVS